MKKRALLASAVWIGIVWGTTVAGETPLPGKDVTAPAVKTQTLCPVMGGAINKALFVDHMGKRIYVCCQGCIPVVKADPAKIIRKLESEGITLDAAETPANSVK